MQELITIKNTRGYLDENGTAHLNLEDVSKGLGFTQRQKKHGKIYESIRWERVADYLTEFGFPPQVGEEIFIPENIVYKLCFKASNEVARAFQNLVADEILPTIRKHGAYLTPPTLDELLEDPDNFIRLINDLKAERAKRKAVEQEAEALEVALNESLKFYTVAKYNKVFGMGWNMKECQTMGKEISAYCRVRAIEIRQCETNDERFGAVNSYPMTAWEDFLQRNGG